MTASREDRKLARRLLAGDEASFEAFFEDAFPRLFRFALVRVGHDEEAARDAVQATLCKALDHLQRYRGDAPLFTWLCTICRNEIVDHHRRHRWQAWAALIEDAPSVRDALRRLAAERSDDVETARRRRELGRLVHATLDHLPERYAKALEIRYLEGLSVARVAARLGLGYKAAESVLSRARDAFKSAFEQVTTALAAEAADGAGGAR
jgi:RNA polymerase sigma-70 factor, ECF subfamily